MGVDSHRERRRGGRCRLGLGAGLISALVLLLRPVPSAAQAGPVVFNPANGHYYQEVGVPGGLLWDAANQAAQSMSYQGIPGHLATITSAEENQFIMDSLPNAILGHWFIGGYQTPTANEPAGDWHWVTGEPFVYTNWQDGEPNNADGDDRMHILNNGKWNDLPSKEGYAYGGYIAEYSVLTVTLLELIPNPTTGNKTVTGQVTLGDPAGLSGTVVFLSSNNPAVAEPTASSILIAPGARSGTFRIKTRKVSQTTVVTISAMLNDGVPKSRDLIVTP
jgi:hypothetical protein